MAANALELASHSYEDIFDDILQDTRLDETFPELRAAFEDAREHAPSEPTGEPPGGSRGLFGDITGAIFKWNSEFFVRTFLKYLRSRDDKVFNKAYALLDPDLQKKLTGFLDGQSVDHLFGPGEKVFNIPSSQASKEKFLKLGDAVDTAPAGGARGGLTGGDDDIGVSVSIYASNPI